MTRWTQLTKVKQEKKPCRGQASVLNTLSAQEQEVMHNHNYDIKLNQHLFITRK